MRSRHLRQVVTLVLGRVYVRGGGAGNGSLLYLEGEFTLEGGGSPGNREGVVRDGESSRV